MVEIKDPKSMLKYFEGFGVRAAWDPEQEEWYFSVVDVISALTQSERPRKYWNDLKIKLQEEGSELSDKIGQLKMPSADGKVRFTDVATTAQIFRLIQSIPSPKELTDEWRRSGVKGNEYAILTSILTKAWSGMTPKDYKAHKGLMKENLRDNMTNTELVLNMLAEVSTTEISRATNPDGFKESASVAKQGGDIARNARLELEQKTGKSVISSGNAGDMKL